MRTSSNPGWSNDNRRLGGGSSASTRSIQRGAQESLALARPFADWILATIVFIAPLFMGGRQPTGRLVLIALCGLLAVVWFWRQRKSASVSDLNSPPARDAWNAPLATLWLLGILLLGIQLVPLGDSWRQRLSPEIDKVLPLWNTPAGEDLGFDGWSTVSLTPLETHRGLVLLVAYGLLFIVVLQRMRGWDDVIAIVRLIAVAGAVMAVIAVLQRFVGNGKFLWVYQHPYRLGDDAVKGPFTNQNHLGGFLTLTMAPWIYLWRFQDNSKPAQWQPSQLLSRDTFSSVAPLALGVVVVAALMTFSRGVMLTTAVALAAYCCFRWREMASRQRKGLLVVAAAVAVALLVYGAEPLRRQLATLNTNVSEMSSARAALWKAMGKAIPHYLVVGAGVGSHREVYPQYMPQNFGVELTHGENGYLQLLLETGATGLLLMLVGWGIVLRAAWQIYRRATTPEHRGVGAVVLACAVASLFHSMGDFVWYIPGYMTLLILLSAAAVRGAQLAAQEGKSPDPSRSQRTPPPPQPLSSGAWGILAGGAACATIWMCAVSLPPARAGRHWDNYLRLSLDAGKRNPSSMDVPLLKSLMGHLHKTVAADPHRARPRLRLASVQLKLFERLQMESENPMPLAHLRSAAEDSKEAFGNFEAQREWLERAVGENLNNAQEALQHAKLALQACPLQGDAYVLVAELEMLSSYHTHREDLLKQALRVRPHSGSVLFAVGNHFAFQGQPERATKYWRAAFHRQPEVRSVLLQMLAPQVPAAELIKSMRPTVEMLESVRIAYANQKRVEDARFVAAQMAAIAERAARDGDDPQWRIAQRAWGLAAQHPRSALCGMEAVKLAPANFSVRWQLAVSLHAAGQLDLARSHAQWCRQRRPDDEQVAQLCDRLQLRQTASSISAPPHQTGQTRQGRVW